MVKYRFILIILVIICGLTLVGFGCNNKNTTAVSTAIENEEIIIKTDAVLENDIRQRLQPLIDENIMPIKIDNNATNADIAIFFNDNTDTNNYSTIYVKQVNISPEAINNTLSKDLKPITISYKAKKDTQLTDQIKNFLLQSYAANPPKENKLVFAGDILASRWVAKVSNDHNDSLYCFSQTASVTKDADLSIANLEAPFAETGPYTNMGVIFRSDPKLAAGLTYSGFDILNLANNHFGDSGQAGMDFTFKTLSDRNINYYGAGKDQTAARTPLIKEINGIKYAFLGYTDPAFSPVSSEADATYAGVNLMNIDTLKEDLKKAKEQADFVVVTMNSGVEYTHDPNETQIDFAHQAIQNGADMIFGLHPHVVQAIEYYQGKPIFYNVGNFIMDQLERETLQGYVIQMSTIYNHISSINLMPYHIYEYCQPRFTDDEETTEIITDIVDASLKLK